jgi:ech hydrogenase subunit D
MHALAEALPLPASELPAATRRLRAAGWRFVTATAVPEPEGWMLLYHFERDEQLCHLRTRVERDEPVPAIDDAYPAAFLVENEMSELQGVRFSGLSIDYGGRLYRDFSGPEGWIHVHGPGAGEVASRICPVERDDR